MGGGLNSYGYVGGNPVKLIDPFGLAYSPGGEHGLPYSSLTNVGVLSPIPQRVQTGLLGFAQIVSGSATTLLGGTVATCGAPTGVAVPIGGALAIGGAMQTSQGIINLSNALFGQYEQPLSQGDIVLELLNVNNNIDHPNVLRNSVNAYGTVVSIGSLAGIPRNTAEFFGTLATAVTLHEDFQSMTSPESCNCK